MKKLNLTITLLFILLLFQSCQKDGFNEEAINSLEISTTRASKGYGSSKGKTCNKLFLQSNPITVSWEDYFYIIDKLKNPGVSITNCDEVFMSFNTNNLVTWESRVENSIITDGISGSNITFHIEELQLYCKDCYFSFPLCSEIGNGLDVVSGTSNSNCILGEFTFENSQEQYITIGFSSYINIASCAVAYCPGNDGV